MSDRICPECNAALPAEAINIAEGVALCGICGQLLRLSDVLDATETHEEFERWVNGPPSGCSIENFGNEFKFTASLQSAAGFLGSLAMCLFWNGIVSVFVSVAISGLWLNLVGDPPHWFPAPKMNNKPMSLGMTIFLCLFLTPFLVIGFGMLMSVLATAMGRIQVIVRPREGKVLTGFGPFNWPQRFDPREVRSVTEGLSSWTNNDEHQPQIHIDADKMVKFGSLLRDERRKWLRAMLRELLVSKNPSRIDRISASHRGGANK